MNVFKSFFVSTFLISINDMIFKLVCNIINAKVAIFWQITKYCYLYFQFFSDCRPLPPPNHALHIPILRARAHVEVFTKLLSSATFSDSNLIYNTLCVAVNLIFLPYICHVLPQSASFRHKFSKKYILDAVKNTSGMKFQRHPR